MRPRLFLRGFRFTTFLVAISRLFAQEIPSVAIISNNGEPMRVPYACSEDDLQ